MANTKISALTAYTPALTTDILAVVDLTTGTTKKITLANLKVSLSLNSVENTALSTWAGTANITTLGTIVTGTWSGTAIALNKITALTASELVGSDASGFLVSLAVATYPSLTELTYVKGVTSALQTQLGLKAPLASPTFTGTVTIPTPFTIGAVSMTATGTELNYVVGVTSAIQTQINTKAPSTAPTFATSITGSYLTASEILITDASKNIISAAVATYPSLTELTYVKGVTSAIQTQLGTKVTSGGALGTPSSGTGTNITGIPAANILAGSFGAGAYVISTSLQAATIELGHATDTTLARVSAGVVSIEGVNIADVSSAQTLTTKTLIATSNVVEEITTIADSATPTPTGGSLRNFFTITALAQAATFAAPSGTPANGNKLTIRIKDNATARALSWNAIYRAGTDVALPTTTVLSKTLYLGFIYNGVDTKWDLLAKVDNI